MSGRLLIAVDGPAASGKGTVARALAARFGLPHLDTGLLYRAVGLTVLRTHADPADAAAALAACGFDDLLLGDPELRSEAAGAAASIVSAQAAVRAALIERQRRFADQPAGAVLDGRDIGTVIAPDARPKLFVTAKPEIRAERRHRELEATGGSPGLAAVLADIRARDDRDASRAAAPLRMAEDAVLIDTSALSIEEVIRAAVAAVRGRGGERLTI